MKKRSVAIPLASCLALVCTVALCFVLGSETLQGSAPKKSSYRSYYAYISTINGNGEPDEWLWSMTNTLHPYTEEEIWALAQAQDANALEIARFEIWDKPKPIDLSSDVYFYFPPGEATAIEMTPEEFTELYGPSRE